MDHLSSLSPPFKDHAQHDDNEAIDTSEEHAKGALGEDEEEEDTTAIKDDDSEDSEESGGLSEWKRIKQEAIESPQDNGGGLSDWKTKRKRNGLKGRTPKHPMNKRPYTC